MTPPFPFEFRPSIFTNSFIRTFEPKVLQVVHVTGNAAVAALPDGLTAGHSPFQDWMYAARNAGSADGPSANDYVGREGSTMELWDPETHVAWSNGDLKSPRLDLPGVKYLADLKAKGINANKGCYREIELSGYPGSFDPTDAQLEVCAWFAATDSIKTGIDIVLHETMLTHGYINTVDRQNCAFRPAIREARMKELCDRAIAIRAELTTGDAVIPLSITSEAPTEVQVPKGTPYLDLDGVTVLDKDGPSDDLDWRPSPYSVVPHLHAIYATVNGVRRVVLVKDVPAREVPDVAAAVAAQREKDRTAALAAVAAAIP